MRTAYITLQIQSLAPLKPNAYLLCVKGQNFFDKPYTEENPFIAANGVRVFFGEKGYVAFSRTGLIDDPSVLCIGRSRLVGANYLDIHEVERQRHAGIDHISFIVGAVRQFNRDHEYPDGIDTETIKPGEVVTVE